MIGRRVRAVLLALVTGALGGGGAAGQACSWDWVGEDPASIGIGRLLCVGGECEINLPEPDGGRAHRFSTEPMVTELAPPARGILRDLDVIVAVDSVPITTLEGGRRLARIEVGVPVTLKIRRAAERIDVRLVPVPGCPTGALSVRRRPPGSR